MRADRLAALAAALAVSAATAAEPVLGTLFHTPQERERLDRLRRGEAIAGPVAEGEAPRPPRVTGFVKRNDGRDTVFIDGRAYPASGARAEQLAQPKAVAPGGEALPPDAVRVERKAEGPPRR